MAITNKLEKEEFIYKVRVKKEGSTGAQFKIKLSEKGFSLLLQLKSRKILPERFPTKKVEPLKPDDPKKKGLEKILRVYSGELFDIVLETVEKVIGDILKIQFENIPFQNQKEVVDTINLAVLNIRNKTSEIAELFF